VIAHRRVQPNESHVVTRFFFICDQSIKSNVSTKDTALVAEIKAAVESTGFHD
jgi:hypothetical protein